LNGNVPFGGGVFQECALSGQTRGRLEGRSGRTTCSTLPLRELGKNHCAMRVVARVIRLSRWEQLTLLLFVGKGSIEKKV
jgi:hypothetical protein